MNARFSHTATLLPGGKVYIGGGAIDSTVYDDAVTAVEPDELFDPAAGTSQAAGKLQRAYHTATLLQNGDVLFTGGIVDVNDEGYVLTATAMLLKTGSGLLQPTGSMSLTREAHTATLLQDGRVVIAGGYDLVADGNTYGPGPVPNSSVLVPVTDSEIYKPSTGVFSKGPTMRARRSVHTATPMPDGSVLFLGGRETSVGLNGLNGNAEIYQ